EIIDLGPNVQPFPTDAPSALTSIDIDVHVDLEKFIDFEAELSRLDKLQEKLNKQISGKKSKLDNENFVSRAPDQVVAREREALEDLLRQSESVMRDIERLRAKIAQAS
ncbi:MAG: valine--tRNA ligase, partial [Pirellulales bacterium]|nr:valine--tRNA ligase [Pirellulales bacterium]